MNQREDYTEFYKTQIRPGKRRWFITGGIVLFLVLFLMSFAELFMEYIQIRELGQEYLSVFWTNFNVRISAQVLGFIILYILFFINLLLIRKIANSIISVPAFLLKNWVLIVLTLIISFFGSTMISSGLYTRILMFFNATDYGAADPVFGQDIGYYMFTRPFYMSLFSSLSGILLFQLAYTVLIYFMVTAKAFGQRRESFLVFRGMFRERGMGIHVIICVILYFIVVAASYRFKAEQLLYGAFGKNGEIFGAGFTDINVWLWYYQIAPFLILGIVLFTFIFLFRKKFLWCAVLIAIFPASFVITGLFAEVVQTVVVNPDEQNKESAYIGYNLEGTQKAYDLDQIEFKRFDVKNDLTAGQINANMESIEDIRIVDYRALLTATNQLQLIKYYYRFNDVDIVPYTLKGKLTALAISARELNKDNLSENSKTYVNTKFRYTHGFGAVLSPVNKVTSEGQPLFYLKDIPPVSTEGLPEITQPRIYYGELVNDYVIAGNNEFDYSDADKDYDFSYDGKSGIKLGFLNRLIFSLYYGDFNLLVSGNITENSKLLLNRNIVQRARLIAPFLTYEPDPYMIVSDDGRLKWVVDGYSVSDMFPYSQPYKNTRMNYIRNSVKVIIDAYDGTMDFYVIDTNDPIIKTFQKIYPKLFKTEAIPEEIARHIRIPEWMFTVQAAMFEQYHVSTPAEFYNKSDLWRIATEKYENEIIPMEPYFNIMKLEDEEDEELMLIMPYTSGNRDNMVGWMAAVSSGENYGKLVVYEFPKTTNVYGPLQIENKIDNDPDISRELALWNSGGSNVIRGNMLVIPFQSSLLYVEPIYITAKNQASLPEVKRIVVSFKDRIVMEPTMKEAIKAIFGENIDMTAPAQTEPTPSPSPAVPAVPAEPDGDAFSMVAKLFGEYKSYSAAGDWENAGRKLKELESLIESLQNQ